jgi:hypothetical protein
VSTLPVVVTESSKEVTLHIQHPLEKVRSLPRDLCVNMFPVS